MNISIMYETVSVKVSGKVSGKVSVKVYWIHSVTRPLENLFRTTSELLHNPTPFKPLNKTLHTFLYLVSDKKTI